MQMQKITAALPQELLQRVQRLTGLGITETLREALENYARMKAYKNLSELRGKVKFAIDLNELRKDRDEE